MLGHAITAPVSVACVSVGVAVLRCCGVAVLRCCGVAVCLAMVWCVACTLLQPATFFGTAAKLGDDNRIGDGSVFKDSAVLGVGNHVGENAKFGTVGDYCCCYYDYCGYCPFYPSLSSTTTTAAATTKTAVLLRLLRLLPLLSFPLFYYYDCCN